MDNEIKLEIASVLSNVGVVRVALTAFITPIGLTLDEIMEIKTAVSEAVTNSIEHAYSDKLNSNVIIIAKLSEIDNMKYICVIIQDFGMGIENVELATTPGYTSKPELEHAGMGFTIMETFMDEVIIDSEVNKGTTITLTKKLSNKKTNVIKGE